MSDHYKLDPRRFSAGIIGLMMLVIVLLTSFYIAGEAAHDCPGHDCPICSFIHQCENTLGQMGGGLVVQIALILPAILLFTAVLFEEIQLSQATLVSQKVRLND